MDSLLKEITLLPGVLGCFVFTGKQQIAASKMPPLFKENKIKTIGNLIARTIQIGNVAQLNFKEVEIMYAESLLMITPLAQKALLVTFCEPKANKSLITMTCGMLAPDIATAMTLPQTPSSPKSQAAPQQAQAPKTRPKQAAPVKVKISAELVPVLEQIKDALAMAIGPIAGPVMKDCIVLWLKKNNPTRSNLPALALLLCAEINNDVMEQDFMARINQIS